MIVTVLIVMLIVSIAINIWLAIWIKTEKETDEIIRESYKRRIKYWIEMNRKTMTAASVPKELIEAAKYAMIRAHPDNGGKQEEFIKYRDIYQRAKEAAG